MGCKAMLGEVEGFSLALNYTAEDRRRQEWERGREKGWSNGIHCRSYLSSLNRCRPGCSLYCSTKAFWQKHTHRHAHTSFWTNQCILVSVISQGALLCLPLGEQGDKASQGGENLLLSALLFIALVCFLSSPHFLYWFQVTCCSLYSVYIYTICNVLLYWCIKWYCRKLWAICLNSIKCRLIIRLNYTTSYSWLFSIVFSLLFGVTVTGFTCTPISH